MPGTSTRRRDDLLGRRRAQGRHNRAAPRPARGHSASSAGDRPQARRASSDAPRTAACVGQPRRLQPPQDRRRRRGRDLLAHDRRTGARRTRPACGAAAAARCAPARGRSAARSRHSTRAPAARSASVSIRVSRALHRPSRSSSLEYAAPGPPKARAHAAPLDGACRIPDTACAMTDTTPDQPRRTSPTTAAPSATSRCWSPRRRFSAPDADDLRRRRAAGQMIAPHPRAGDDRRSR